MKRRVDPELLDSLPPADPRAVRSRRDLQRINAVMGHPQIMARALAAALDGGAAPRITEIGAGDGRFLLGVARCLKGRWNPVEATLVDRLDAFDRSAEPRFRELGWVVQVKTQDVRTWLQPQNDPRETIIANLFLHHFSAPALAELLQLAARSARAVIAVEPRRGKWSFCSSRMLWALGCNAITRHDAPVSVRAGFTGSELSALWPDIQNWRLTERRAGLFSHLFIAQRKH
jgi:Methyltransferase domain